MSTADDGPPLDPEQAAVIRAQLGPHMDSTDAAQDDAA